MRMPEKPRPTAADYLAMAVSPALIMVLVGSFVFYLLDLGYAGPHAGRLRWTLFWFVMATVLVARIALIEGFAYASVYGVLLAWATAMMIFRFVDFVAGVLALLGFIWWCGSRLTRNCTWLDEAEESDAEGLLRAGKLTLEAPPPPAQPTRAVSMPPPAPPAAATVRHGQSIAPPLPPPLPVPVPGARVSLAPARRPRRPRPAARPAAPGVWVVYFSLIALPVFGLGQALVPAEAMALKAYGFRLLWAYVAAALGLLLVTSFLGLRRYLRQRYLVMPPAIARTWFSLGSGLALAILLGALLLPRPEMVYSLADWAGKIGSPPATASTTALRTDSGAPGASRRTVADPSGPEAGAQSPNAALDSTASSAGQAGDGAPPRGAPASSGGSEPSPVTSSAPSVSLPDWARLAQACFYGMLGILLLVGCWRNRRAIAQAFARFAQVWRAWWQRLFGRPDSAPAAQGRTGPRASPGRPRFAGFRDPFATAEGARLSAAELTCYTFEALQAWGEMWEVPRIPDQTPLEYARRLGQAFPELTAAVGHCARLYSQVAYGGTAPAPEQVAKLAALWRQWAAWDRIPTKLGFSQPR